MSCALPEALQSAGPEPEGKEQGLKPSEDGGHRWGKPRFQEEMATRCHRCPLVTYGRSHALGGSQCSGQRLYEDVAVSVQQEAAAGHGFGARQGGDPQHPTSPQNSGEEGHDCLHKHPSSQGATGWDKVASLGC